MTTKKASHLTLIVNKVHGLYPAAKKRRYYSECEIGNTAYQIINTIQKKSAEGSKSLYFINKWTQYQSKVSTFNCRLKTFS